MNYDRPLKPWAQEEADDFYHWYGTGNCSCHISSPCGSCIHSGNPLNLAETEDAWGFDLEYEIDHAIARVHQHIENEVNRHLKEMNAAHGIKE